MKKIQVKLDAASYDVLIAEGLLRDAGKLVRRRCSEPSLCVVITSPRIRRLWGKKLESSLRAAKLKFVVLEMPDGESHKNISTIERLLKSMVAAGVDRSSVVIAFGGGVIGDVAGFVASIYMRGIPVMQIPTTLLAQVDASIGGKTGVDLLAGKNLVGTFHQPKFVLIDPHVLSTLPARERRAGMFEVIKCGVISDAKLFRSLERTPVRDEALLLSTIVASVKIKADVVSRDEREGGLRRILNFGHTIGHALEADGGYKRLLHGEAVGWGMIAAAEIGRELGVTPVEEADRITRLVLRNGPLPPVTSPASNILRLIKSDKKTQRGVPMFVLATSIGKTIISDKVPTAVITKAIAKLRTLSKAAR